MTEETVLFSIDNGNAIVTLNRPEKLNALNREIMSTLDDIMNRIEETEGLRCLILTGLGKAFCSGGDIADWASLPAETFGHSWVRRGHRLFDRLAQLRVPVIAAMNGHALGGGLELAACADIRIADPRAKIGLPETSIGVVPGWSGTQRLVNRFGYGLVARMALGGEIFTADEAKNLRLVDIVSAEGEVMKTALAYADRISARSPTANEITKMMMLNAGAEGAAAATEALGSILSAKTNDRAEGVAAFIQKRPAHFKGD
jgi:enoyl-CoA hydratase